MIYLQHYIIDELTSHMSIQIKTDADLLMLLDSLKTESSAKVLKNGIVANTPIFQTLDISCQPRNVDGVTSTYFSIDNVVVSPKYRRQGYLKSLYDMVHRLSVPVMWYDVINKDLEKFLKSKGYVEHFVNKNNYLAKCLIKP